MVEEIKQERKTTFHCGFPLQRTTEGTVNICTEVDTAQTECSWSSAIKSRIIWGYICAKCRWEICFAIFHICKWERAKHPQNVLCYFFVPSWKERRTWTCTLYPWGLWNKKLDSEYCCTLIILHILTESKTTVHLPSHKEFVTCNSGA